MDEDPFDGRMSNKSTIKIVQRARESIVGRGATPRSASAGRAPATSHTPGGLEPQSGTQSVPGCGPSPTERNGPGGVRGLFESDGTDVGLATEATRADDGDLPVASGGRRQHFSDASTGKPTDAPWIRIRQSMEGIVSILGDAIHPPIYFPILGDAKPYLGMPHSSC